MGFASDTIGARRGPTSARTAERSAERLTDDLVWLRWAIPLVTSAAIFGLALAFRLPNLLDVPGFTDESIDIRVALDVLRGQWPLVDQEPYIGSAWNFVLAAGFLLLGNHGFVPRLVVALLGAGTV